jgi:murein DD-endopeptidase MepM/ murein hydrolase activator NlpD
MAINPQKFLPSSKEGALTKINKSIVQTSSIGFSNKTIDNFGIIRVKVIQIEDVLKGSLALEKKKLTEEKKKDSSKRREKIEEKLETKPKVESGRIKMPSLPRMGFLDWVKNFIGNVILGYFAVRLVDHLPKIIPIVKFLGKATDLILGLGGKLLDGLVTFVDWGYKAVDFSRGLVGKTFGEDALKNFDKLTSEFQKFMNLAIIVGMASADFGMDRLKSRGAEKAAKKGAGTIGGRGVGRAATRAAARVGGKGAAKLTTKVGSKALKAVPFLGAGLAIVEGIMRIRDGDYVGGLLSFGTAIPVAGWAFLALDIAREFMGGKEFDKSVGRAFSGNSGLTDKQVQKRTPRFSGPSIVTGLANGGLTRSGKRQGRVRRKLTSSKKGKYKRALAPKKPGRVDVNSPGSAIGGEEKILGIFPKPKLPDVMNPFKVIENFAKNTTGSDYFGPIFGIASKYLLGQKPTQQDYKNVGLGINMLVAKGIDDGKLKGGLVAAFAEGGFVDPKTLDAISQGGDISDWVAKAFKDATETNAQKTLRELQKNLNLKKPGDEKTPPSPDDMGEGAGVQVSSDSEDFWLLATAAMFENSNPQGAADVAQVIYNRTQYPAWNAPNIRKAILNPGQFQPVRQYGGTNAWAAIKTKEDALRFSKTHGKTQEQLERVAAALLDKSRQNDARSFVGPRDSFRAEAYERANNHLANETEKTRHGHTFGFEPGGAMIGQFKAGKLSAAMVNVQVSGSVSQKGLPSLPPTGTIGGQNYGDSRSGGRRHAGQDYDISGNQKFYSRIGGEVVNIGYDPSGYGNYVDIYNKQLNVTERIAEGAKVLVSRGNIVKKGQAVVQGETNTGVIHYEIRKGRNTTFGFDGTIDPKKFLTSSSAFIGKSFGIVPKGGLRLTLHDGEMFKVIDKDSVNLLGYDLTKEIIDIENQSQLIAKAPSIIEKLKVISGYTDYEQPYSKPEVVYVPTIIREEDYESFGSSGSLVSMVDGEESDPFDSLYVGS